MKDKNERIEVKKIKDDFVVSEDNVVILIDPWEKSVDAIVKARKETLKADEGSYYYQ